MNFQNICRLCLQKFTGPAEILHKDFKAFKMIKHLFPGMDFNMVKLSKVCTECSKQIEFSYSVRETVIKNEKIIKLNMASIKTIENNMCRLCLNTDILDAPVFLYAKPNEVMSFIEARGIIEIAILVLNFDLFKRPVICNSCWQITKSIYLFKKKCFATEKILKFYCTENNLTSLTNKEIEFVSNSYNLNLQNFSKGQNLDISKNLAQIKTMDNPQQSVSNFISNITRPLDVYLNNFTTDDEDDIFEENKDDIFIEASKILKEEPCPPEERKTNDDITENLDEIGVEISTVKEEPAYDQESSHIDVTRSDLDTSQGNQTSNKQSEDVENLNIDSKNILSAETKNAFCDKKSNIEKPGSLKNSNNRKSLGEKRTEATKRKRQFKDLLKSSHDEEQTVKKQKSAKLKAKVLENEGFFEAVIGNPKIQKRKNKKAKKPVGFEWPCSECDFKTKYKQHLHRHSLIHNKNATLLTCSECVYSTIIKRNFNRHMLKHTANNFLQCFHCAYSTVNKSNLIKHMSIHQKTASNSKIVKVKEIDEMHFLDFQCQECPYVTSRNGQFQAHIRTHKSSEKVLKCSECHYITTRTHSLKDHMELHKKDSVSKNFKCSQCAFTAKRYTHLASHMLAHETEYKLSCNECSYKAKRKSHLVTHMLRHQSGDKKITFQCPYCPYKSVRRDYLKLHCRNRHYDKGEVDL